MDGAPVVGTIHWAPKWTIYKFKDPDNAVAKHMGAGGDPYQAPNAPFAVEEFPGNVALNKGLYNVIQVIAKTSGTFTKTLRWSNSYAYLYVGTHSSAAAATQTGLLAASSSRAKSSMDAGWPTRTSTTVKWRTTFSSSAANFPWYEYSVRNTNTQTSGFGLDRKIATKGTKSSGETWTLELDITFS
jgi:hypothetical protein